jgi:hypothetical protein
MLTSPGTLALDKRGAQEAMVVCVFVKVCEK